MPLSSDPFNEKRRCPGVLSAEFQGDKIPMILRHADVKAAAKDWEKFSSDAPFRVPIPSEEAMRSVRQLPIETDPPAHTAYRKIVTPFFRRPNQPAMIEKVEALVTRLVDDAMGRDEIEIVREFALPLQSIALTYLLDVPESEADEWISWGIHVFHDGEDAGAKGSVLDAYIERQIDRAKIDPGDDFFTALTHADLEGRKLTRDEMIGYANLTFAGGRDTIIHTVASIIAHFADHAEGLARLRDEPKLVFTATEEFVRVVSPLTHIGRVCPVETDVLGESVAAGERVSLCWSSANRDGDVFESPDEVRYDRRPNPHLAFGNGTHFCLGAAHARLIVRTLLNTLSERVGDIDVLAASPNVESTPDYTREVGFDALTVRLRPR